MEDLLVDGLQVGLPQRQDSRDLLRAVRPREEGRLRDAAGVDQELDHLNGC